MAVYLPYPPSAFQFQLPTADGAVADARLLFDALLIAAGLEQAANMSALGFAVCLAHVALPVARPDLT